MQDYFGESHDGHVFRTDDALDAGCGHARATHSEKLGFLTISSEFMGERGGKKSTVVFAAGFAG
jgi:hypothetical protein